MNHSLRIFLLLACCLITACLAQNDPAKNFCRRWGHQTAVVDRKLYIDGGMINYERYKAKENYTSRYRYFELAKPR